MRTPFSCLSIVLSALLCASGALAQGAATGSGQAYPTKPIRLIVPYPPAGTTDFVAREVGFKTGELLGQQIVIDNRPGAGTLIGLTQGVRAAPDGYTITFGTSAGLSVNPALGTKMPFDPQRDFIPIGLMVYVPYLLVVNPSLPVRNLKEFIDLAKTQPGKLNFASPGVGTSNHLGIEMLNSYAGVKFVHVPYKGGAPAITDLVAGQVQAIFSGTPQISSFVKSGRLRIIASATPKPTRVAPEVPTIAETYPGFDCNTWYGLLAPTGTPASIVTRINTELNRALSDLGVIQRLLDQGVEATPGTAAAFRQLIVAETERWRKVIKSAGITAEAAQ
ncbi:MAG TPA: tripartite tricarboxylate transporter substrate binding protein [Burkholderiales bacterium]|nr:tripartite tricarboxylate transporter substrate binding protein [Burkholderiales bacterium]